MVGGLSPRQFSVVCAREQTGFHLRPLGAKLKHTMKALILVSYVNIPKLAKPSERTIVIFMNIYRNYA